MRRFILAATSAAVITLGGCTAAQITQTAATIEADIQAGAAAACSIIPTIGTIATVALTIFGQSNLAAITSAAQQAIIAEICTAAPTKASAKYRALPTPGNIPAVIGQSRGGVTVTGWKS